MGTVEHKVTGIQKYLQVKSFVLIMCPSFLAVKIIISYNSCMLSVHQLLYRGRFLI